MENFDFNHYSNLFNIKVSEFCEIAIGRSIHLIEPVSNYINNNASLKKHLVLLVSSIALLLDNMLYMSIVPIANTLLEHGTQLGGNGQYAILFASKAVVQLIVNPLTGHCIDTIGYTKPLFLGLLILLVTTVGFSFITNFYLLVFVRGLQGAGSALADTSAFGLIVDRYTNLDTRRRCLGIANACISFGSLISPPFIGTLAAVSKVVAFLFLAFMCFLNIVLLLVHVKNSGSKNDQNSENNIENGLETIEVGINHDILNPVSGELSSGGGNLTKKLTRRDSLCAGPEVKGTPFTELIRDPYILVVAGALTIANFPLAFIEPMIGKYMEQQFGSSEQIIGLVWLPSWIPHLLGVFLTVIASEKFKDFQWFYGGLGMVITGISGPILANVTGEWQFIAPLCFMCFGVAVIDTALLPLLAFIVDSRHTSVYGSVYAIADISYCIAYAAGPLLAGYFETTFGFQTMNLAVGFINILYAPILIYLKETYSWSQNKNEQRGLLGDDDFDGQVGNLDDDDLDLTATDLNNLQNESRKQAMANQMANQSLWDDQDYADSEEDDVKFF